MRLLTAILLLLVTAIPLAAAPPVSFTSTCRQTVRDRVATVNADSDAMIAAGHKTGHIVQVRCVPEGLNEHGEVFQACLQKSRTEEGRAGCQTAFGPDGFGTGALMEYLIRAHDGRVMRWEPDQGSNELVRMLLFGF
jgi:hypothetical protein